MYYVQGQENCFLKHKFGKFIEVALRRIEQLLPSNRGSLLCVKAFLTLDTKKKDIA